MFKNRLSSTVTIVAVLALFVSTPALAQGGGSQPIGIGPMVGYDLDGESPILGGDFRIGLPFQIAENDVLLDADFEYYLDTPDGTTIFSIQAAGLVPLALRNSQVRPVLGAGLNYIRFSADSPIGNISSSDIHLALIGGIMVRAFFTDVSLRVGDGSTAVVRVGFLFLGNMM